MKRMLAALFCALMLGISGCTGGVKNENFLEKAEEQSIELEKEPLIRANVDGKSLDLSVSQLESLANEWFVHNEDIHLEQSESDAGTYSALLQTGLRLSAAVNDQGEVTAFYFISQSVEGNEDYPDRSATIADLQQTCLYLAGCGKEQTKVIEDALVQRMNDSVLDDQFYYGSYVQDHLKWTRQLVKVDKVSIVQDGVAFSESVSDDLYIRSQEYKQDQQENLADFAQALKGESKEEKDDKPDSAK